MSLNSNIEPLQHFQRLKTEQENYLFDCNDRLDKWQKFKNDYLVLKNRLEVLPHELRYDIMVPISKNAFMPGRLVNTNEILVLLGDNWFVEKSAKQACDMIDRRLINIEASIQEIQKEIGMYKDHFKWTNDVMNEKGEFVNIEEKIDDKEIKKSKNKMTDEEIKILRQKQQERALKAQEDINKELQKQKENIFQDKKQVKFSDSNESLENIEYDSDDDDDDDDDDESFIDTDDYPLCPTSSKTSTIKITHTKNEILDSIDKRLRLSRDKPNLDNPGDIYNLYYKPKSILKNKDDPILIKPQDENINQQKEAKNILNEKFEPEKAFTGEILERSVKQTEGNQSENITKKPVSKFRASKMN